MERSTHRILTTHTGSLPRPRDLLDSSLSGQEREDRIQAVVLETVQRQADSGIDIVDDGEMSKPGFVYYLRERVSGFEEAGEPTMFTLVDGFPGYREWYRQTRSDAPQVGRPRAACLGPLAWNDKAPLQRDIANLLAARDSTGSVEAFMPSASVGIVAQRLPNLYYPNYEAYVEAIAGLMSEEYQAIVDSGLLLQIDAPEMCIDRMVPEFAHRPIEDFRTRLELWVEGLNFALQGIDEDRVRLHICWGNEEAPHTCDVSLPEILDIVLKVNAGAYVIEAANPRHAHDWHIWEDTKLPEGKVLIPGVIDSTTNFVEHPQLVADRIITYANLVGRESILAGTDCGFATNAMFSAVYPPIVWAKLIALGEGAALASARLWP